MTLHFFPRFAFAGAGAWSWREKTALERKDVFTVKRGEIVSF